MYADGLRKATRGLTVAEEVQRVVPPDDAPEESTEEEDDATADAETTPARPAVPAPLSAEVRVPRPPRILVVDDDPTLVEIVAEILAEDHYEVLTAANGHDALALVYREHPDLVLTDLQMPRLDGLELLRRLRRDLSTCQIPVVFLTVVDELDAEVRALDLGADDYIAKPVQKARLLGRVQRALVRSHLLRAAR